MTDFLENSLQNLKDKGLYRSLKTVEGPQDSEILVQGRRLINFSSNNYLGLAHHPVLINAAIEATRNYGTGSGASRLITGSMRVHEELEEAIATFKGAEKALLFNSGYHANIGVISSLMRDGGVIFSDSLNHASLIDGCRLSKAQVQVYRHNDRTHLQALLEEASQNNSRKLIITDTIFSMDGDLCLLPDIMNLAEKYKAFVLVDEAHATGVLGRRGRGAVEHFGVQSSHPYLIQMGTLGKALGSFGAYVVGSRDLIDWLINTARSFVYTTALPPGVAAASQAAIQLVSNDLSFKEKLWENVAYFNKKLRAITQFSDIPSVSPIFPIILGSAEKTMEASLSLFDKGIWIQGIRPPTVPEGTARLRLTLMSTHTRDQLDRCLEALKEIL